MKKMRRKRMVILSVLLILAMLILPGFYNGLRIQNYSIEVDEITNPIRIALVTDLHSCKYGEKEQELMEAIDSQNPDLVMLVGDIFDDVIPDTNTEYLLQGIADLYPCYYVTGNHEYWSGSGFSEKMDILAKYSIIRLSGKMETIAINGETINICGVDDPDVYMSASADKYKDTVSFIDQLIHVRELSQNGHYTILLSHRPESFELYAYHQFDLVLCGHAHGGQWRIPGIVNGLYAPNQGFFPKYAGGKYQAEDTTMIVSRGLARESTRIPRFYNRPELVIVDLQ